MAITYNGSGGGVPRKTAHIFASDAAATDVTVFGSTLDNDTQYTTDIADIQNSAFEEGWRGAVISNKNYPLLADMNGVMLTFSQQLAYILQHGLAAWDSATTYYTYDIVNVNGILYISTDDNNINNNPSTLTQWAVFYDPSDFANKDLSNLTATGENHFANKDLSNLTTTGKTEVINLAYELDYDNIITITTTSSLDQRTYICPDDGIVCAVASAVAGTNTKRATTYVGPASDLMVSGSGITTAASGSQTSHAMFTFLKGQTAYYSAVASGGTTSNEVLVQFIPFKKS